MEQIINMISQKSGISKEQAEKAAHAFIDFLKNKLPEPAASQVENVIREGGGDAMDLGKGLGGLIK